MYNTSIRKQNSFNAQVTFVDHAVANVTRALASKGPWQPLSIKFRTSESVKIEMLEWTTVVLHRPPQPPLRATAAVGRRGPHSVAGRIQTAEN